MYDLVCPTVGRLPPFGGGLKMGSKDRLAPSSRTCTRHVTALGKAARNEYWNLREKYKGEGLSPREAVERAYTELKIKARYLELKNRVEVREALGEGVPLTPMEMAGVSPRIKPEDIGDREMTVQEQIKWAMGKAARVQNGADPPVKFPCEGALFWYQSAVGNRREFEKRVERIEAPGGDVDNMYLQDSQYHFSELEKQLKRAREECGSRFLEMEREFKESLKKDTKVDIG